MIVIGLLLTPLATIVFLTGTTEGTGPLPSDYSNGDRIIGSDYAVDTWSVTSLYTMNGNLTIRAGGVVTVNGGGLVFAENIGSDKIAGTADDRVYTLTVEDGGKLILNNSTLTTNLNQLNSFPSLGVIVRNGGVLEAYDSVLSFPGHMVVDDSTLNLWRSNITGNEEVGVYCNDTYFPEAVFQYAPVLLFMSSTVNLYDSSLPNIYQTPNSTTYNTTQLYSAMYDHSYSFASDINNATTGARDSVAYNLARMPSAKGAADNTGSALQGLKVSDLQYYNVASGKTMWLDGFDTGGLVFSASDNILATLHVQYYTDSGYSSASTVQYQYRNGAAGQTTLSFSNTPVNPVTGTADQVIASATLPAMSSLDLAGLNLGFTNNGGQTIHINKVWITFRIVEPAYTSINLAGNTQFTAVNSYLGVDFSNKENHNTMVLRDNSMAYLYGVTVDTSPEKTVSPANRQAAFVAHDRTVEALVTSKSSNDTTGQSIGSLTSIDSSYYNIASGRVMELNGFNTSDLIGPLSGATLTLTYSTEGSYAIGNYLQWRASDGTFHNTAIRPQQTPAAVSVSFNLYDKGVTEVSDVKDLELRFSNSDPSNSVYVSKISVAMTVSPTIYIYRWANVTVTDMQSLPVNGAAVTSTLQNSGASAEYYTPDGLRSYPSDEVLHYLGKDMTDYTITDNEGKVKLPYLSEVLDQANPNPYAAYAYVLTVSYENSTGAVYTNTTGLAFNPYPDMSAGNTWKMVNITMPALALELPDLVVLPLTLTPTTVYDGESVQVSAVVHNRGKTTATKVEVSIIGYINGSIPAFWSNQTVDTIAPGTENDQALTAVIWHDVPKGVHTISVTIDPERKISEESKNNNVMSVQFTVLANLAELTVSSTDITFSPQPASSSDLVTATIYVNNTGRAAATNATVSLYAGSATEGGQFIGSTTVTVSAGSFVKTTLSWKPTQIGTYPVYVYVNADHSIAEYGYDNNAAFKSMTVTMTIDGHDLVVGGSEYPTLTITGPNAFNWAYNVVVINNGVLTIRNTAFTEVQSSAYQSRIVVQDNGTLVLSGGTILNSNYNLNLYLMGHSNLTVTGSKVMTPVHIRADDSSKVYIASSEMGADLAAPDTSYAHVAVQDTIFSHAWSSFGGHAVADVTNISIASLNAQGSAVINHYRWVKVVVLDGTGEKLPNAYVAITHPVNGLYASGRTGSDGTITFRVLTDARTAGMTVYQGFIGDYFANTTYTYQGQSFAGQYAMNVGIVGYSEPLSQANMAPVTISIPGALPDLDPPIHVSTSTPVHYQNVTVTTTVSNVGVVAAHNVLVMFNDTGSTFYQYTIPVIQPGESITINAIWTARTLGQHNISVVIDPYGRINELDNTNNANYTMVAVQGIADLSVQRSDVTISPNSPARGQTSTISAKVWNYGDITAEDVMVSFYVTYGSSRTLLTNAVIGTIDQGESGEATVSWTPSNPGTYTVEVVVDGNGAIEEISEANNTVSFSQKVLNYADLRPNYVVLNPASPVNVGDVINIEAAVKNIGEVAAINVSVYFYLDSTNGNPFDVETIASINPDQTVTVTGQWTAVLLANGASSTNIYVVVNPSGATNYVNEMNTDNNVITQSLVVNDLRADLQFSDGVTVTQSGQEITNASQGETVDISATAKNGGSTAAISAAFYFYAVDGNGKQTFIGVAMRNLAAGAEVTVNTTWQINLTMGSYHLLVVANADGIVDDKDTTNNNVSAVFNIDAPNAKVEIYALDSTSYAPGSNIFVTGRVYNRNTSEAIPGAVVIVWLERDGVRIGEPFNGTTNSEGIFAIQLYVPEGSDGNYQVHGESSMGDKVFTTSKNVTIAASGSGGIPWYVYLMILAVIAAAIILFSAWLYKYGLGKMVECGECGALIPESSKRCPKCGVEFEVGTAKCSECSAWIPSNSATCPECGAKFIGDAIEEEEDAYLKKMREQYEAYVDTFREEAKKAMGKKYSDSKFQEWFKKQPSYVSFESWLSQEEEKRKFTGVSCPTCGTLNPRGSPICHKCGSNIEVRKPEIPAAEEQPKSEAAPKPLRRIVRRPVEKRPVKPAEPKPEEQPKLDDGAKPPQ
ncbi:MAG: CARDB domain-containing protein [Methanomassiliicoccus sp.]|nr:CARDB domain-containing protein [Methanomassiliicoccus sp.]